MDGKAFTIGEAFSFGWQTFKKNAWFLIGIILLLAVLQLLMGRNDESLSGLLFWIIILVVQFVVSIGITKITLKLYDGDSVSWRDLYASYRLLWRFVAVSFLYGLMVAVGFVFLIIPGIILGIIFQFAMYLVVDKNMGVFESFRKSAELTRGFRWDLLLFNITVIGLNILGVMLLVIGLIVTLPVTWLAIAYVYRKLESRGMTSTQPQPATTPTPAGAL